MRNFLRDMNSEILAKKYPGMKWQEYMKSNEFKTLIKRAKD